MLVGPDHLRCADDQHPWNDHRNVDNQKDRTGGVRFLRKEGEEELQGLGDLAKVSKRKARFDS